MPFQLHKVWPRRRRELIAYRRRENLSQVEAAARLGVSSVTWHYLENGTRNPSVDMAKRLAKLTGISASRMLGLDPAALRKRTLRQRLRRAS